MKESNNTVKNGSATTELSSTESTTVTSSKDYAESASDVLIGVTNTEYTQKEFLMSDEEFLDLIPVNGYFH